MARGDKTPDDDTPDEAPAGVPPGTGEQPEPVEHEGDRPGEGAEPLTPAEQPGDSPGVADRELDSADELTPTTMPDE